MEVVIMAGGKGTRLRPFTTLLPKPLVPVGDKAILSIVLEQLRAARVKKVTLAVNHLADLIMSFFGTGEKFGMTIKYSMERQSLGTIGPLKLIDDLPEDFLVMNGDILTDLDYNALYKSHLNAGVPLTIAMYQRDVTIDFGVLHTDESNSRLCRFIEKPTYHFNVSMGVYVFNRSVINRIPSDRPFGFDELVRAMLAASEPIQTQIFKGYWLDLGRPDDYDQANRDIEQLPFLRSAACSGH